MRPRQLKGLASTSRSERVERIAEGLGALARHLERLAVDIEVLEDAGRAAAAEVLAGLATEEAAKVFILLDYARAGFDGGDLLGRTHRNFYNHVARHIYAMTYMGSPADFAEVVDYAEYLRRSRVLDGFEGFEFAVGNPATSRREALLYVDLVSHDGGLSWHDPTSEWVSTLPNLRSPAADVALAMSRCGLFSDNGLRAIDEVWAGEEATLDWHWLRMQQKNAEVLTHPDVVAGRSADVQSDDLRSAVEQWGFPLVGLDLALIDVTHEELEVERSAAREAWLHAEFGD